MMMAEKAKTWVSCPRVGSILALAVLVWMTGCGEEVEIRRYQVPRVKEPRAPQSWRLLGAIIPHGEKIWFFKVDGPIKDITEQKDAFDRFIRTVEFTKSGPEPIAWKLPSNWQQEPGKDMRYATIKMGSREMVVTPLGKEAASVEENVNRWRRQIGLGPVGPVELTEMTSEIEVGGQPVTLVDMAGPGPGRPKAARAKDLGNSGDLKYETPEGWEEFPPRQGRVATFMVKEGGKLAEVAVTKFPGTTGTLPDNVNRWREQVGLDKVPDDKVLRDIKKLSLDGAPAPYVDVAGPLARILVVSYERNDENWFFKMTGPPDLVEAQKKAFETFIQSVRFKGSAGR